MNAVRILTAAALGAALLGFANDAQASGNKKGGNSKGGISIKGGKGVAQSGGHKHKHNHKHHAPVVKYHRPIVVLPVVPIVPAGAVMELPGYFGLRPGHVLLDMHGQIVHPKVVAWTPRGLVVEIPFMKLPAPVYGKLVVIGWDKFAYRPVDVKIVPPLGVPAGGPAIGPTGPPKGPIVSAKL